MATHVRPPQSAELKKVLKLHKQIDNINSLISQNEERLKTLKSASVSNSHHCHELRREVRTLKKHISKLQEELKKLPALCGWCNGEQLIITGLQTDLICSMCRGDGLQDGPTSRAYREEVAEMVKKMTRGKKFLPIKISHPS